MSLQGVYFVHPFHFIYFVRMRLNENNSDTDYANKIKESLYFIIFLCAYFINLLYFIYFIRIGLDENNEDDLSFYLILIR